MAENKKVKVVIGAFGDAAKCKEKLDALKAAKFEGAKLLKSGRFTYVVAGECERAEAPELIKRLKGSKFDGYILKA